jgi:hypothetical protein
MPVTVLLIIGIAPTHGGPRTTLSYSILIFEKCLIGITVSTSAV